MSSGTTNHQERSTNHHSHHHGHHGGGADIPPHPDSRFRGQHREDIDYDFLIIFYNVKIAIFTVLFIVALFGLVLSILTIRRKKMRRYSSTVYLAANVGFDAILMFFYYLPSFLLEVYEKIEFDPGLCTMIRTMDFIGTIGACTVVVILALERILVLRYPTNTGIQMFATAKVAAVVSLLTVVVVSCLSGSTVYDVIWNGQGRFCSVNNLTESIDENVQKLIPIVLVFILTSMQLILDVILGYILRQRHVSRAVDPVHTNTSAARQRNNQLNKINLIVFIMSLVCFIVVVPKCVYLLLVWFKFWIHFTSMSRLVLVTLIDLFSVALMALKPFIIAALSPKIRREGLLALKCAPENNRLKELGIEVNPIKRAKLKAGNSALVDLTEQLSVDETNIYNI